MPKKKNWFARIKDLFFPVSDEQERKLKKNKKKKKKLLLGWMRTTKRPPSLAAPSASEERTDNKAEKEESNQINLAEAAPAASDGVGASTCTRFGGVSSPTLPTSTSQCEDKASESEHQVAEIRLSHSQLLRHVEDLAAIKIQTAFRGYLARKALRALKGLVRLQAIIRGRAVRRQAVATLKSLQSIVSIHSQVCATRYQVAKEKRPNEDGRDVQDFKHDGLKRMQIELSSPYRRWDDRLVTKEEETAVFFSKTDAMMRRHRMKAYSFNHRHSADQWEEARRNGRLRSWLEEHDEEEDVPQKEEIKRVDTIGGKQMRPRSTTTEAMLQDPPAAMIPRRPLHRRKRRPVSDGKMEGGEPAYMAATESARARARPTSCSPRLRPMQLDCYSDGDSPYKLKLSSPMSSINSERTCSGGVVSGKSIGRSSSKGVIKLSPKPYFDS